MREECILAYCQARDDVKASLSKTPFCLKFIEIMGEYEQLEEFRMPEKLQNEAEMVKRIESLLFSKTVPDGQTLPNGIIAQIAVLTIEKKGGGSIFEDRQARADKQLRLLEACIDENGNWDTNSEVFKQIAAQKATEPNPAGHTPEVMAKRSLEYLRQATEVLVEGLQRDQKFIRMVNAKNGHCFRPGRDDNNAAAQVSKIYDETLGAGGIDLAAFDV